MLKTWKNCLVLSVLVISYLFIFGTSTLAAPTIRRALLDVNRNGYIDQSDKRLVRTYFGIENPTGVQALADVNQNHRINGMDFSLLAKSVGQSVSQCETADINNDHGVNTTDLEIIGQYYDQEDTSENMMADLNGDGSIDLLDLTLAGGVFGCTW